MKTKSAKTYDDYTPLCILHKTGLPHTMMALLSVEEVYVHILNKI